jgi:hypothetical protein
LQIPALQIDAAVQKSLSIPYVDTPSPGCPRRPDGETVTVPDQGIASPVERLEGLENKVWIYGHSRWLSRSQTFFSLQDIKVGDELIVDGVDRQTGERLTGLRFVVDSLYLADTDSGEELITASGPEDIPRKPVVVLQTSVREDGPGKQWILNREQLLAKSKNIVQGDLDDPCKYLLFFVHGQPS